MAEGKNFGFLLPGVLKYAAMGLRETAQAVSPFLFKGGEGKC